MQAINIKEVDQTTTTRLGHLSLLVHPFDSINSTSQKSYGYFKKQGLQNVRIAKSKGELYSAITTH